MYSNHGDIDLIKDKCQGVVTMEILTLSKTSIKV